MTITRTATNPIITSFSVSFDFDFSASIVASVDCKRGDAVKILKNKYFTTHYFSISGSFVLSQLSKAHFCRKWQPNKQYHLVWLK